MLAFAQTVDDDEDKKKKRKVVYKERTEIVFGNDAEVVGELITPGISLTTGRVRGSFNPLIELRTDFDVEMKRSVSQVQ